MNDIATAAGKVRRTLYTHFKSKEDIYWAVVESEIMQLIERLKSIVNQKILAFGLLCSIGILLQIL